MPPSNLPSTLFDLVRLGVHEDGAQAHDTPTTRLAPRVLDNRALIQALDASRATVGRRCRPGVYPSPETLGASWTPTERAPHAAAKPTRAQSMFPRRTVAAAAM
jgi:predicted DNA-binding transcriptional regulator AlpA